MMDLRGCLSRFCLEPVYQDALEIEPIIRHIAIVREQSILGFVKYAFSSRNFLGNRRGADRCLKDHGDRVLQPMGDPPERHEAVKIEPFMTASGIDGAQVNLPQSVSEAAKKGLCFLHRGIHLACVPDVEAECRLRQFRKEWLELGRSSPDFLPTVHVLDADCRTEPSPQAHIIN